MKKIYAFIGMLFCSVVVWGQISITSTGTAFPENFDGMGTSGTATLPTGFKVGSDWATGVTATTLAYGTTGTGVVTGTSAGGIINWANGVTASATDRSLGFLTTGTFTGPRSIILSFTNNTGATITSLAISFDYEKSRSGVRQFDWTFFHGNTSTATISATGGDQSYAADVNNTTIFNPPTAINKSFNLTGLSITNGTSYYLRWTFTGLGGSTNGQGISIDNFSITASAGAVAGTSTITAGAGAEPATLSSLVNTLGTASLNFDFTVTDDGATNDANPTLISQIVLNQGSNNAAQLANWTQAIAGAELSDGTNTASGTINAANITFAALPNTLATDIGYIADDANKTYTLKIWLKAALGGTLPTTIDGRQFEFLIQTSGVTTAASGSSVIAASQSVSSGLSKNVVTVTASQLAYVQNTTTPTGVNAAMTPAVTVSANDANGNRDLDFVSNIDITSTGTLAGSPVSIAAVAGFASFATLTHTATGTGLTLTAASTVTSIVSNPFDIQTPSSATDYFRSKVSGNWGNSTTWQSSPDNSTWNDATLIPDANANTITIRTGHTVTVAAAAGGDQVVVETGATLTLGAAFTLADGAGADLTVDGTVINTAGTHVFTGTGAFNANSLYQHNRNGGAIPTATWDATSTVEVTGGTTAAPTNISQTLGNFTWNSPTSTTTNLVGTLTTVAGNFRVQNSGTAALRLTGSADLNLVVNGNFIIEDDMDIDNNVTGVCNISIGGNFSHTGGVFQSSTDVATITMAGVNKTFTQSGGTFTGTNLNWIIGSGASVTLANNLPVSTTRTVTVDGTLDAPILQITGAGGVIINGTLKSANTNGIGAAGTLANTGAISFGASSTTEFNAVGAQTFSARSDYANVVISGGGNKSLAGNTTLSGNLTLTNGKVVLGANDLTVNGTITGGSSTNYIQTDGSGALTVNNITTGKTLPIGNAKYNPLIIENGSGHNWTAKVADGLVADPGFPTNKAVLVTWNITPSVNPPAAGADLTFQFDEATSPAGQTGANFTTAENVQAWHRTSYWIPSGNPAPVLGTAGASTVKVTGITQFSPYALSNVSGLLPITINYFTGAKQGSNHLLNWKVTCSATPKATMVLERSADSRNFSNINTIVADAARCDQPFNYIDVQPLKGMNYYRLKMIDIDGKISYSGIVALLNAVKGFDIISIAPNPVVDANFKLNVTNAVASKMDIIIVDMQGRLVNKQTVSAIAGFNSLPINVSQLAAGTYSIQVAIADEKSRVIRFVKQ